MKKIIIAVTIVALCSVLFAFVNQPERQKIEYKWFKYQAGEGGIPAPDATSAKQASNYVLVGDAPYCNGMNDYCGILAQPSDETTSALPVLGTQEESEIDDFFNDPDNYFGSVVNRKN